MFRTKMYSFGSNLDRFFLEKLAQKKNTNKRLSFLTYRIKQYICV